MMIEIKSSTGNKFYVNELQDQRIRIGLPNSSGQYTTNKAFLNGE